MMQQTPNAARMSAHIANPFAMMVDPAGVIAAMQGSERLSHLERRICRPLDTLHRRPAADAGLASFDDGIDADVDADEDIDQGE